MNHGKESIVKRLFKKVKDHKILACSLLGVVLVAGIASGTAYGMHAKKIANTQRALEIAASGEITEEDLEALEMDGGFADFGTEVVDPSTGETVVLTQDENGHIVRTVTKDASGNNTGAIIPENHSGGGNTPSPSPEPSPTPSPSPSPTPTPEHQHVWVAHQATRQVPYTETINHPAVTHQERYDACNICGADATYDAHHSHDGHLASTHGAYRTVVDQAAWTETVTKYRTENYVDYYYCSDCGARQ